MFNWLKQVWHAVTGTEEHDGTTSFPLARKRQISAKSSIPGRNRGRKVKSRKGNDIEGECEEEKSSNERPRKKRRHHSPVRSHRSIPSKHDRKDNRSTSPHRNPPSSRHSFKRLWSLHSDNNVKSSHPAPTKSYYSSQWSHRESSHIRSSGVGQQTPYHSDDDASVSAHSESEDSCSTCSHDDTVTQEIQDVNIPDDGDSTLNHKVVELSPDQIEGGWNGWPQGNFHTKFSWKEFEEFNELKVDWAVSYQGGRQVKGASINAENPNQGKRIYRRCLGYLQCDNKHCQRIFPPKSKPEARRKQIGQLCPCNQYDETTKELLTNYRLQHFPCPNVAKIVKWKGGVWYWNGVEHNHGTLHRKKRLSPLEKKQSNALIKANPTATPAALRSGNTVSGQSLLNISDRYITENVARIEVRKARGPKEPSMDVLVAKLCAFQQEYPNYIIACHILNGIAVISCQTQWMAERLVHASQSGNGFTGLVSDAAHGWFAVPTSLLVTSSIFSPSMACWVPGIYSYTNGATAVHYEYHFLAMMRSAWQTKLQLGEIVHDADFAGTVDFSQAQRLGFIEAFVRFWMEDASNNRTEKQLREVAVSLLRGCAQHFCSQVTRVKQLIPLIFS